MTRHNLSHAFVTVLIITVSILGGIVPTTTRAASPSGEAADSLAAPPAADADATALPPEAEPALSDSTIPKADRVLSVEVTGLERVDTLLVVRTFRVRSGDAYSQATVRDGVKALYRLGLFDDINVDGDPSPEGVRLTIRIVESPRVTAVEFTGNRGVDTDKLQDKITGTVGKVASGKTLKEVKEKLAKVYVDEGYPLAEVVADYTPGEKPLDRILAITITERTKVQIKTITFQGNFSLNPDDLRGEMKENHQKSFWKKGHLKPEALEEDLGKVQTYFQRHGYRDARILSHDIKYSEDGRFADLVVQVDQGPLYTLTGYATEGNKTLSTGQLAGLVKFKEGDRYNRQKVDESASEIGGAYADRGYLYAQVDPEERVDSTGVFVTYRIVEQEPSKVRQVNITGNTRTKERVIRRQLYIYPGQKFDRELLIRSQRELFQMGFFQDVGVDFKPLPNSYDVDLELKVAEKAVGTASAGAGYSNQAGLTGFLELGHPNLFGNGQAVNIRLERGGQTSNLELSFTEPWFMNRPILLGVDFFNTRYKRNLINNVDSDRYDVRRQGGALRLGRAIPGLSYARANLSYSYERTTGFNATRIDEGYQTVTTTAGETTTTTNSRVIYDPDPIRIDPSGRTTSSITMGVTRNSTDHPLYPHAGASTTLSAEYASRFLGGNVTFQKYSMENKAFFKSPGIKKMKPALMLKTRMGGVDFFGRKDPLRVPLDPADAGKGPNDRLYSRESVELFQLGGTTSWGLRGYDDFSIVPLDNVIVRKVTTSQVITTTVRGVPVSSSVQDSTYYTYDTFPGGKLFSTMTLEHQFLITEPIHALVFAEAGGVWNNLKDITWPSLHKSVGVGLRMEIPLLGLVGFDYAYGFDGLNTDRTRPVPRDELYKKGGWKFHFLFGRPF